MFYEIFYKLVCFFKEPVSEECSLHHVKLRRGLAREWVTGEFGPQPIEVLAVKFQYPYANSRIDVGCCPSPKHRLLPVTYCLECRRTERMWAKKSFKEKLKELQKYVESQPDGHDKDQLEEYLKIAPEAHSMHQKTLRQIYGNSIMRFFCSELEDKS